MRNKSEQNKLFVHIVILVKDKKDMAFEGSMSTLITRRAMREEFLDPETELDLAYAWRDNRDEVALHRLVNAYMRLAISMASKFKRYGAPMSDLIQEAGLGLMKAAEKFDPERGVRFSTYAVWWIKASVQDYVMRNWSLVRTGSTSSQKSLFFNLRRVQAQMEREASKKGEKLPKSQLHEKVAAQVGVSIGDVEMMDGRLSGTDFSLNASQASDDEGREWLELLEDDSEKVEEAFENDHDTGKLRGWLLDALNSLNAREKFIVRERKMIPEPRTLECLGDELKLSKERVRQLESAALRKMKKFLENNVDEVGYFLEETLCQKN